jgi:signal transduction histidine kinase
VASARWRQWIRPHDLVWLLLFSVMAVTGPQRDAGVIALLFALAILQVLEQKITFLAPPRGAIVANLLKLGLCKGILASTGEVNSSYFWILLIPVVSAATALGGAGAVVFTLLACGTYLAVDWGHYEFEPGQAAELSLRLVFLAIIGYLAQRLAEAQRTEALRAQAAAEQLAQANQSLQAAEAAVRRSERLAALGQLSAGLAHELRNPLGTIRASAEMLVKNVPPGSEMIAELAGFISSEVDRTNSLVTRFLEFARPLELRPARAELTEVIDRAIIQLGRATPPYDVTVYRNYSPEVPPFSFDAELMERVFYNLLLNAAQATPPGGEVTVKTRIADDNVEITVIDRGAGIDAPDMESIFNPFFTTKKEGLGLGLAIVSRIVDLHGGKTAVESDPGKGSVFRVFLPIRDE